MAILGKVNPATTAPTILYTAPAGRNPLVNVNCANIGTTEAAFTLGLVREADKSLLSVAVATGGEYASIPTIAISGSANTTAAAVVVSTLEVNSVAITLPGTGYSVGTVLSVVGGTKTATTTLTVVSVDANGVILSVSLTQKGNYSVLPASSVSVTGATGTGATFSLTWALLTASVTAGGNGYTPATAVFSTTGGGAITQATFTAQYGIVFEALSDTYHPFTNMIGSAVVERTGISLSAGDSIVAISNLPNAINFIALGYEDLA